MSRIELSDDRKKAILASLTAFYGDTFDEPLSTYQAERLLLFFVAELGPPVYNQGVQDARTYISDKLDDIEGDIYEPDPSR
ncbi:MAG: DUF2164 family protein [Candidatus Latescibacteria bacterium]|nr:DUF2164 family protein [Candidatus Latescibacterota bacterium]